MKEKGRIIFDAWVLQKAPDPPCLDRREEITCASSFSISMNYIYLVILGTLRGTPGPTVL